MALGIRGFGPRLALAAVAVALTALIGRLGGAWLTHAIGEGDLSSTLWTAAVPVDLVAILAALLATGWWVNRAGARRPLVAGLFMLAASGATFAIARTPEPFFAARTLETIAMTMTWTASLALVIETRGTRGRGTAIGVVLAAAAIGTLAGRLLGHLLVAEAGLLAITLLATALALTAAVVGRYWVTDGAASEPRVAPAVRSRRAAVAGVSALTALGAFFLVAQYMLMPQSTLMVNGVGPSAVAFGAWALLLVRAIAPLLAGFLLRHVRPMRLVGAGCALAGVALALDRLESVPAVLAAHIALVVAGTFVLASALALGGEVAEARARPNRGTIAACCVLAYGVAPSAGAFMVLGS